MKRVTVGEAYRGCYAGYSGGCPGYAEVTCTHPDYFILVTCTWLVYSNTISFSYTGFHFTCT